MEQLSLPDLERLVSLVLALLAQRKALSLPLAEAELLLKINRGIPEATQKYYNELIARRQAEILTPDEYSQLLQLTEQIEKLEAQRLEYLAQLARLRKTSYPKRARSAIAGLMENLGIQTPAYA